MTKTKSIGASFLAAIAILASLLAGIVLMGCASAPLPPPDAAQSRSALESALNSWQAGETSSTWSGKPIRFSDGRFQKGVKLVAYEIGPEQDYGYDRQIQVMLTLRYARAKTHKEKTVYDVRTRPDIVIAKVEDE
jgi:hypothetical protein